MPQEYARFTQRRALWKELGMTPDNTAHREWDEAVSMMRIEARHAKDEK